MEFYATYSILFDVIQQHYVTLSNLLIFQYYTLKVYKKRNIYNCW